MKPPEQLEQNIEEDGVIIRKANLNHVLHLFSIEVFFPDFSKAETVVARLNSHPEYFEMEDCTRGIFCDDDSLVKHDNTMFIDFTVNFFLKKKFTELFNIHFDPKDLDVQDSVKIDYEEIKKEGQKEIVTKYVQNNPTIMERIKYFFVNLLSNF